MTRERPQQHPSSRKTRRRRLLRRFVGLGLALLVCMSALASPEESHCPADMRKDGKTLDEEFGAGTAAKTRCVKHRSGLRILVQVNRLYEVDEKPYALAHLKRAVLDYQQTYGMKLGQDFTVAAVFYGQGAAYGLNNQAAKPHSTRNPFQPLVEELLAMGVELYFCQNTMRRYGVMADQVVPGFRYVSSGLTAVVDFQKDGYILLLP